MQMIPFSLPHRNWNACSLTWKLNRLTSVTGNPQWNILSSPQKLTQEALSETMCLSSAKDTQQRLKYSRRKALGKKGDDKELFAELVLIWAK